MDKITKTRLLKMTMAMSAGVEQYTDCIPVER